MGTFKLPDLGEGLAEAEILEWHVKPGDHVLVDQPMVSVETAKAVVEVPVPYSGIVTALHGAVGDILATGAPLIDFDSGTVVGSMPVTSAEEFVESATTGRARAQWRGPQPRRPGGARARAPPGTRSRRASRAAGPADSSRSDDVLATRMPPPRQRADRRAGTAHGTARHAEPLRGARRAMAHSMSLSRDQVPLSTVCDDADIHAWTQRGDYMLRLMRALIAAWRAEPALECLVRCGQQFAHPAQAHRPRHRRRYAGGPDRAGIAQYPEQDAR